jgi:hypothetical protein
MGADASPLIDSALENNPYLQTTIKYMIISLVSKIETVSGVARKTAVSNLGAANCGKQLSILTPRRLARHCAQDPIRGGTGIEERWSLI